MKTLKIAVVFLVVAISNFFIATASTGNWSAPNWAVGNLPNGAREPLTITAKVNPVVSHTTTAIITAMKNDPRPGNNSVSSTLVVNHPPADNNNDLTAFPLQKGDCADETVNILTITVTAANQPPVNQAPTANNDKAATNEGIPAVINVLTNPAGMDTDADGTLDPASVDLNPDETGIQKTFTNTKTGTYTVDKDGLVTFIPVLNYNGTSAIGYTVSDNLGLVSNIAVLTITVIIANKRAPIPDLSSLLQITEQGSVAAITPPTATDIHGRKVMGTTTTVFPITKSTIVEWTFSDGVNTSYQYQYVIINDTTPPTISCIGDQFLYCVVIPDYTTLVSAADNCDPSVVIRQTPAPGSPFTDGTTIKMEAVDSKGNSSQCSFKVIKNTLSVNAGSDLYIKEGETVQLQATASTSGNFKWNPASGLINLYVSNPTASPLQTTTYIVTCRTPDGCEVQDNVTVFVQQNPKDDTKYGISPNDDGINDFWKINTIEENLDNEVYIYNQWGDLVFYTKNYNNTSNVFNGTANHRKNIGTDILPEGIYFFDIKIKGSHHLKKTTGFLVLKR